MFYFLFLPFRYFKTTLLSGGILFLCLLPSSEFPDLKVTITYLDVIVHFFMYLVFSIVLFLDIKKYHAGKINRFFLCFILVLISVVFGSVTEILQNYIIFLNRTGSYVDLLFDIFGSVTGSIIMTFTMKKPVPE